MSAKYWTACPKCVAAVAERRAKREKEIQQSYGKVPPERYMAAVQEFKDSEPADTKPCETCLREDYELGIRKGKFFVVYGANCSECDFEYRYVHEEDLK